MKVALLISSLGDGGAERVMSSLANSWAKRGDEVTLITLHSAARDAYLLDSRVRRVALGLAQESNGIWGALANNWWRIRAFRRELRNSRATVALSFEERTNVLAVLASVGMPIRLVISERTDPAAHHVGHAWSLMRRLVYPLADGLVVQTARLLSWAKPVMLWRKCVHVIPNSLRAMRSVPLESPESERPSVIAVGRLGREKGHDLLIKAFARVASDFPAWTLTIVGAGPEREHLMNLACAEGISERFALPGWTPTPEAVLAHAALFVMPSRYEGFSNSLLEAMGAGLPVISTRCGGSEEMIDHGTSGLLVDIEHVEGLAAAMRQLMADSALRKRMARGALEASSRYTPSAVMPLWDEVLGNGAYASNGGRSFVSPTNVFQRASASILSIITSASALAPFRRRVAASVDLTAHAPKILFLTRRLDVGGAQRQLAALALELHTAGWNVKVLTFYSGGELQADLLRAGVEMITLEKAGRWDVLQFVQRLITLIRRERPHVLHGYLTTANILLALLRPCFRGARIVWGVRSSNMDLRRYGYLAKLESRMAVTLSHLADLIICNSHAGRAFHQKQGYRSDKMIVIPNGVDIRQFYPNDQARREVREQWGIAPDEVLVGLIARLDPMKDHATFLQAAAKVDALRKNVRFVCVGDGPSQYRDRLVDDARSRGLDKHLIWAGARPDMDRIYNALDLSVSSSSFGEGFPNAIVEAMATGVPCVVTDVGDSAAIVGELGWVCPPADSAALCAAIIAGVDAMPYDRAAIRSHVVESYSASALLARSLARLEPLVAPASIAPGILGWRPK